MTARWTPPQRKSDVTRVSLAGRSTFMLVLRPRLGSNW
jgi:hypothetical protein